MIANEINSVIKEILKLICNETKSSYLLLTKDIPKMNPGKKYSKHTHTQKVIILIGYIEFNIASNGTMNKDHHFYCKN